VACNFNTPIEYFFYNVVSLCLLNNLPFLENDLMSTKYKYKFRSLLDLTKQFKIRSDRQPCNICEIDNFIKANNK